MNDVAFYVGVCMGLVGFCVGYLIGRASVLEEWKDFAVGNKEGWEEEALYWRHKLFGKPEED